MIHCGTDNQNFNHEPKRVGFKDWSTPKQENTSECIFADEDFWKKLICDHQSGPNTTDAVVRIINRRFS